MRVDERGNSGPVTNSGRGRAPTILDAVGEVLDGGQIPEGDSGHEDTTESRRQSAAAGVREVRSKYGEGYRSIPWPE